MGKYRRGMEDKCWVILNCDDIKEKIDDQLTDLSKLLNSRFIGPFLDRVRTWERALNIVSECIDLWLMV